jgi:hypothetical protein
MRKDLCQKKECLLVFAFFAVVLFTSCVTAEIGCCARGLSGIACVEVEEGECASGELFAANALCSESAFCELGCCYNDNDGIFDKGVLENDCTFSGWSWAPDPFCNIAGADLGCCILGDIVQFQTQGQCNNDAILLGIEDAEWKRDVSEAQCLLIPHLGDRGACVYNDNSCTFTSRDSCIQNSGSFAQGVLCTANTLNTTCEPTEQTTCLNGVDEVYFVDSCGNAANIYDSGRVNDQSYWENKISKGDSCGEGVSNIDSKSCGNCNKYIGSLCSQASEYSFQPDLGDSYCRDLSCEYEGQRYNTGESWCVYDGAVGIDDVVGSRHWQYACNQGTVETLGCEDYRNQICIQSNTEENGVVVRRNAECVTNTWRECLQINVDFSEDAKELETECEKMVNCRLEDAKIADKFRVQACMPLYPGGFDFTDTEVQEEAEELCGIGTQTCRVVRERDWKGSCKVKYNKDCLDEEQFGERMNEICRGLGDCGGEVNIEGAYVSNFILAGRASATTSKYNISNAYIQYLIGLAIPIPDQYAVVDNYTEFLGMVGIAPGDITYNTLATSASLTNRYLSLIGYRRGFSGFDRSWIVEKSGRWWDLFFGSCSSRYRTYQCLPWQPPIGGGDCEKCNGDPLKPCSEYRCESLGAGCELINTESGDPKDFLCVNSCSSGGTAPATSPDIEAASLNIEYSNISSDGFTIQGDSSSCIDPYTTIQFGINTDSPSICRYDYKFSDYENMSEIFRNFYGYNHSKSLTFPDPSHGESQGENWTKDQKLYIKCQDNCGHETPRFYTIDFCINSGPDINAPLVERFVPESGSLVSFDKEAIGVEVITNEVATCKWDIVDKEYYDMSNEFICGDDLGYPSSPFGYLCFGDLPIEDQINTFYVSCADQPWFIGTDNESSRNIGKYTYILEKPDERIKIDWITPDSPMLIGTDKLTIELKIKTSNGGDVHQCFYSMSEEGVKIPMFESGSSDVHTQFLDLSPKHWKIFVACRDDLGDIAEGVAEFEIIKDTSAPLISRVWNDFGEIYIITSEDAECKYSATSCSFNFGDGAPMGNLQIHTIASTPGKEYYVKCKDSLGNLPAKCSIRVTAA